MFDDVLKTLRSQVNERLSSPLIGSFVISWCLWNYKFLVILFSATTVTHTFSLITSIAFPDDRAVILNGFIYPLLTAAIYIFVYPYPARYVYEYTRKKQRETLEIKRRIDDETPLTIEESREIKSQIFKLDEEYERKLDLKDQEVKRLQSEIKSLSSVNPPRKNLIDDDSLLSISSSQITLLKEIERLDGEAFEEYLVSESKESKVKVLYDLGELVKIGLLSRDYTAKGFLYNFTHDGRSFLVKHQVQD